MDFPNFSPLGSQVLEVKRHGMRLPIMLGKLFFMPLAPSKLSYFSKVLKLEAVKSHLGHGLGFVVGKE